MMDAINQAASHVNAALNYLHENAIAIVVCVVILYHIRTRFLVQMGPAGSVLQQQPKTDATTSTSTMEDRRLAMDRARQKQQEESERRSREAAEKRKLKEKEERKRKNENALLKHTGSGHVLGSNRDDHADNNETNKSSKSRGSSRSSSAGGGGGGGGYNPMQPWTASSGGYRAPRRTARRG